MKQKQKYEDEKCVPVAAEYRLGGGTLLCGFHYIERTGGRGGVFIEVSSCTVCGNEMTDGKCRFVNHRQPGSGAL